MTLAPNITRFWLLAATWVAGMSFLPVFGAGGLLVPVSGVCLGALIAAGVCSGRVQVWRPVVVLVTGLLVITETVCRHSTNFGLPTRQTIRLLAGSLDSWQLTLQSTWPAQPDPELLLFVPELLVIAAVIGIELADRVSPLPALLPSLALLALAQMYSALTGSEAVLAGAIYAAAAGGALVRYRPRPARRSAASRRPATRPRRLRTTAVVLSLLVGAIGGAVLLGSFADPARQPYSLQQTRPAAVPAARFSSPLDELAERLGRPTVEAFNYRVAAPVDYWRLVALDTFDGANWTSDSSLKRLGRELAPGPAVTVRLSKEHAAVEMTDLSGPWLPSQTWPAEVSGVDPLVDPDSGMLLSGAADVPRTYSLTWSSPDVEVDTLLNAGIDTTAEVGDVGTVPAGVSELADKAAGTSRPSFRKAAALERYLSTNYQLVKGANLPTGHGWPQVRQFLLETKQGSSEQFAAAYVLLARLNGIPARLVVGFRGPPSAGPDGRYVVRNSDALAWPEVALDGIGWWPLDPAGQADVIRSLAIGRTARTTEQARTRLPAGQPGGGVPDEQAPPPQHGGPLLPAPDLSPWLVLLLPALPIGLIGAVPLAKRLRGTFRRRRRPVEAVMGASEEARDLLRAHRVAWYPGSTVRDLVPVGWTLAGAQGATALNELADTLEMVLWASEVEMADPELADRAWDRVNNLRRGLRRVPRVERWRAAFDPRPLLPLGRVKGDRPRPGSVAEGFRTVAVRRSPGSESNT